MRRGIKIGRLFGIDVRIDWSWLIIFLLVTWNLGSSFTQQHPDWSTALAWGTALAASLLFFSSVLVHEFAHSLTAQARGVNVRSITLFLFGGVSNIQRQPESPGSEFIITIVGPLSSIVLGVVFTLLAGASMPSAVQSMTNPAEALQQLGPVPSVLLLLGSVNFALGIFNLIPGFPLDGGRILRSAFWSATDDLTKATRWASWVGQGIAWALIIAGAAMIFGAELPFFGSGFVNGLWLVFIGWFLNRASAQSYQRIKLEDMLEDVQVSRLMTDDPRSVSPVITVQKLVDDYMMESDFRSFPVVEDGELVGMVALADVRGVDRGEWSGTLVREIMTPREAISSVGPDEDAAEALRTLVQRDVRMLPVEDAGTFVGLLRRRDIVKWLQLQSDGDAPTPQGI